MGSVLAWDGLLPLGVSAIPSAVEVLFPKSDIAEIVTAVVIPIFSALIRSVVGVRQIRTLCEGALPIPRQIALAIAIVLLMLFEAFVAMLTFADDEPPSAWLAPAGFYVFYLATIAIAFVPPKGVAESNEQ
ncbi:MAG: hypothetical protein H0T51_13545 [Pirellulales bacterium]|nr:hypothetical protein [Pirellulales bacterium]